MMRAISATLARHHRVRLLDEAVDAGVRLSARYIPSRQLPDKAISLLDTACARVSLSQSSVPPALERARRYVQQYQTNIDLLEEEERVNGGCAENYQRYRGELQKQQPQREA